MLGKGLESLIPPTHGGNGGGQPAQVPVTPVPAATPEPLLPAAAPEPLLASAPVEVFLPEGDPEPEFVVQQQPQQPPQQEAQQQPQPLPQQEPVAVVPVTPVTPSAAAKPPEIATIAEQYGARPAKMRSESIFYLETDKIHPNLQQPRRYFDEEAINELAASIREFGILQPLVVTKIEKEVPNGTEVEYELIAGERRLQASRRAGLERVPAIIRTVDMARERLELAVIENIQRENLSPIEMGRAFARLQDEFRLTQREIASRLGKSRETVANTMRLLDLPGYIQEALEKGQVSESHGRLLLAIDDPAAQQSLFHDLLNQHLTTRELRRRTAFLNKKETTGTGAPSADAVAPEVKQFEERLSSELGAPVSIRTSGTGGKITIDFYSSEELAQIMQRFREEG